MPRQVARVVIRDRAIAGRRRQLAFAYQVGQELGVMDDLVRAAEVRVLIAQGVEAVRARGHDLRDARAVERLHVLAGEALEGVLIAHPPSRIPRARLARAEDREIHASGLEQLRGRHGGFASPFVEGGRTADPEEDAGSGLAWLKDSHAEALRPLRAVRLRLAPGVRRTVDVAQHRPGLFRESRLDHHEVAP